MNALLLLQDGRRFPGTAVGNTEERIGEVIMNTSVVGYQEMMTDPANAGKILLLTYPLIGNYGVAPKFNESKSVWLSGLIVKELSRTYSNWQAKGSLQEFIKEHKVFLLSGVDTRSLAVYLRQKGQVWAALTKEPCSEKELIARINQRRTQAPESWIAKISVEKALEVTKAGKGKRRIAILDLGVSQSLLGQLEAAGFACTLLPYSMDLRDAAKKYDGLIISNGPEDDPALDRIVESIKPVLGKIPLLGIATGHHVIARCLGVKIVKMKLGHRGVNYPVYKMGSLKGDITVQNHANAVDSAGMSKVKDAKISGYNLNDRTVEEIESKKLKFIGVQYYPASPGCGEANDVFKRFAKLLRKE